MNLTNEQWQRIVSFIPKPKAQSGKSGRPPQESRDILNGILWILRTGAPWVDLPERYPPKSTCHRRFQEWTESGVFAKILTALAQDLKERGGFGDDFYQSTVRAVSTAGENTLLRPSLIRRISGPFIYYIF